MKPQILHLHNIGKIRRAAIRLDGLTVITGKNDTGKSTVGKTVFSLIKAFSRYKEDFRIDKQSEIEEILDKIYFEVHPDFFEQKEGYGIFKSVFLPPVLLEKLSPYLTAGGMSDDEARLILKPYYEFIDNRIRPEFKKRFFDYLDKIKEILISGPAKKDYVYSALNKAFSSEFLMEILPRTIPSTEGSIRYMSGVQTLIDLQVRNDKLSVKEMAEEEINGYFKDVTYMENPVYIQIANLISEADTLWTADLSKERQLSVLRPKTYMHIKDLVNKLLLSRYFVAEGNEKVSHFLNELRKILSGSYYYKEEEGVFTFKNVTGKELHAVNTASGSKTFGVLQLLLMAGAFSNDSLVVMDEPENYLHPEWQVLFASLITELADYGFHILINTHSPYMLQALKHFAEKNGNMSVVKFYLAEKEADGMVVMKDVTANLDPVFRSLAEPFNKIMW